jgi:site-specific DNA-methyltransferase (adenine-specific)
VITTVINADCRKALARMPDDSIDAVVSDPPAGIKFMGAAWDTFIAAAHKGKRNAPLLAFQDFIADVFSEVLRALKPGGHGLVWALPKISHHTAMGLERAGFDVRDLLMHLFGQGFPKSKNLDGDWEGFGTALKPGAEHWILVRKPLAGTVAENVAAHGTGLLNIDACRIMPRDDDDRADYEAKCASVVGLDSNRNGAAYGEWSGVREDSAHAAGRWPANVLLDEEAARLLDEQSGERKSGTGAVKRKSASGTQGNALGKESRPEGTPMLSYGDTGGASRFFYVAKPGKKERNAGGIVENTHPTVKPIELMRWLCRLITPPGGLVLDPFAGSGTTGVAARMEGFDFIGIERDKTYAEIARARIASVAREAA